MHANLSAALPARFLILGESAGILDKPRVRRLLAIVSTKPLYLRRDGPPAVDGETIEPSARGPLDGCPALFFTFSEVTRPAYAPRAITEICYLCERCGSDTQAARRPPGRVATFHCPLHCP
jgi:hypothetical protein